MNNSGIVVIIAFPDTIVRPATGELSSKIWPLFGVGGKNAVQAGHAAMLLVSKKTGSIQYFDFGRYITSDGYGRVRSEVTDCELHIPIKAAIKNGTISNIEDILLFLERSPHKTHGEGRMIVSVNEEIEYKKALSFVTALQAKGEVSYGAFVKNGSNCARLVTDTLLVATTSTTIRKKLKKSYFITPSPISNVLRGRSSNTPIYEVYNQHIHEYKNRAIYKEHLKCLLNKVPQELNEEGTVHPDRNSYYSEKEQWLGGIGSGAWFSIEKSEIATFYKVTRKCSKGKIDLEAVFEDETRVFSIEKPFKIMHGSHCNQCVVRQNDKLFYLKRKVS